MQICKQILFFRLISLKVLNSIVLLGKSCQYVKEAKMEEKLFNPVLTATPGKPAGKQQSTFKSTQGKADCLVMFSAESAFRLNLVLNQM